MQVPDIEHYQRGNFQTTLTKAYVENIMDYLKIMNPEVSEDFLHERVQAIIAERLKRPQLAQIEHATYGNAELKKVDLLEFANDLSDRIVTPAGSTYMKASQKTAFVKQMMQDKLAERKVVKNQMLDHEAKGEKLEARIKNYIQSRIKIGVNSISGAMNSGFNCLYDPAGYNAITSTCRHGCMTGYGHAERLLEGNFYFPTAESCINYAIQLLRVCPSKEHIDTVLDKFDMFRPMPYELLEHWMECLLLYNFPNQVNKLYLQQFVEKLEMHQVAFIYYAFNLKHIFRVNDRPMKAWLHKFFTNPNLDGIDNIEPTDLFKIDSDLLTMATAINPAILEGVLLYDTLKERPDITRRIIAICNKMQTEIDELQPIFDTFLNIDVDIPSAMQHKNMIRKTVIVSDTDSVIFTTKNWVEWYSGPKNYNDEAFQINALIVYLLTKSLIHTFAIMSMNIGMEGEDLRKIAMKNEYLYPVMMRTPMGKHYAGIVTIQEGRVLPKPKTDIKGKNFRGSDLCKETLDTVQEFLLTNIINSYMENYELSAYDLIHTVLKFEHKIKKSIENKEITYFGTEPIKPAEEYANPVSSNYFYYELWQAVFADKYDPIYIPAKCLQIPIDAAQLTSEEYLEWLSKKDKDIHKKLVSFLEQYPKKKITRFFVPTHLDIPDEIIPVIDTRSVIYSNCSPLYLAFRSLGIGVMFKGKQMIFSDMYQLTE